MGEAKEGVVGVAVGRGVVALERLMEARVGRWIGWTSDIGGKGLPLAAIETFDLDFLVDWRGSFSPARLWKRPRKLESMPLDTEA
jgi:hypothetical protein